MRDLLRTKRYVALRSILKDARESLGLSQGQVAARIGRPQTYISDIETGVRRIDSIEFLRIAKALKLDPGEVMIRVNNIPDRF